MKLRSYAEACSPPNTLFRPQQCLKSIAVELRHLRYFAAVAEHLNFTRAAAKLRVAQPALSRQIRDLEEELGVALLERNSRFVRLTPAGVAFVAEARAVLQRAADAVQTARAFVTGQRGEIHIGYAPSPTVELLPQALRLFQDECPAVRVILHDLSAQEILQGLRSGRLDAALTVQGRPKDMRGVAFTKLRAYPLRLAVANGHRLAKASRVSLTKIQPDKLLVYTRHDYPDYFAMLEAMFAGRAAMPEIAEEHDSATSLLAAIEAGRGVAIVPSVLSHLAGPRISFRGIHSAAASVIVGVATQRKNPGLMAARFAATANSIGK